MTKLKEGVSWDFTSVDDYSGYMQGHVVLDKESVEKLGPLVEGTAYCASLQTLYATVVTNFGKEWTLNLLADTQKGIDAEAKTEAMPELTEREQAAKDGGYMVPPEGTSHVAEELDTIAETSGD